MEKKEFVYAAFIRTTPEKLWEALTNGDSARNIGSAFASRLS